MDEEMLKVLKSPLCKKILEFSKRFIKHINPTYRQEFLDYIIKSEDRYVEVINCISYFKRTSKTFKIISKVHVWSMKNDKKYKAMYNQILDGNRTDLLKHSKWFNPDEYI